MNYPTVQTAETFQLTSSRRRKGDFLWHTKLGGRVRPITCRLDASRVVLVGVYQGGQGANFDDFKLRITAAVPQM